MQRERELSCGVVIVAAGRGERAGASTEGPKQYRRIGGRPVIAWTLDAFATWGKAGPIVIVIHPDDEALLETALATCRPRPVVTIVHGGATRQASVLAGLKALSEHGVDCAMIQDAVRPFITPDLLDRCLDKLSAGFEAVLPTIPVTDTLKRASAIGDVQETVSRDRLFAAQTPQCFVLSKILDAHEAAASSGRSDFTDDASIAEWAGIPVALVEGSADNVKLTTRQDLLMADEKLSGRRIDVRTGNGYDVHQLVPGDGVTLCGIFMHHDQSLLGHSDADVALHALTDALLATCGAGDIGDHFPPSDDRWKGAASRIFLEHAAEIVRRHGGVVMNADISLIAEAPKIGPHRDAMRQALSQMLGISLDRCSVKATTNEKIGFVGRREGIAAIATATVSFPDGFR
ncbi:2-C-methyl-D-erythritol 2,4-cyclodiphosphate synthase [Rhizobium sp. PP-F2F-G48]|uniref:bifunctional 2-C-methyl-D-erythritol 4-phosphate cytidylyltransferase/2-C-methyl-D-erythritol 2,4-cyclodiphosphate synthase n=1 Tax=Rhizobium sp. PP-F2F-G48 TaxID=2135651 RepID=UPI00104C33B9|nr:bifunctional 2-C-methyl-D-erythritol 4-phosphate cytidylyltransferase/2-C-methyl-D-erythritol 2,4-cyclodiphosphate synthase [Rhizobium sp. PP-F2F-G48]TCM57359.1 2-C-methyl-D-erythritol 2,4-cyclodiphosphate synthase [Rhizobium sp. PP-F2F-G48]